MKTLAKSVLGVAVAAAVASTSVQAAEEIVTIDPSLTFTYKNYYWDYDNKNKSGNEGKTSEWAHALVADFDTGYVNDLVGAVVTAGYVGALDNDNSFSNVPKASNGKDGNDFSGFQQAYLKARTTLSGVDFAGSVGVKKRGTETYSDSGSRLVAASSMGYDLSAGFGGANFYFTEITGVSGRDDSALSNKTTTGEDLQIIGANYSYEGLGLAAEYGEVDKGKEQTFLKAGYGFDLDDMSSVDLDIRYGKLEVDGTKTESKYHNLNATYNYGNGYVGVGYNKTKDGNYDADYGIGGNNGSFNSSLALWADYANEDEKAYVVNGGYNFADQGLEGLSVDVWYGKGKDAKGVDGFERREYGSYVSYAFDGSFEGLSVAWLYTNYREEGIAPKTGGGTENLDKNDIDVNRFYLTYSVAAF
ncbi:OprD family outer membrane porin [Endozoicomonas ascidiicola]|uniref:OprD family outer membrane porin n=1 Tax=Endozoicomonas ascidiicola TaxID=1698521 RepID=UPI00082B6FFD|nr:OprD family outer membrane porin [Endozoicomonas ascidiicola]